MINYCGSAMRRYENMGMSIALMKLEDVRYAYLKYVYDFIIPLEDTVVRLRNMSDYINYPEYHRRTMASFVPDAKAVFNNILKAESVEECDNQLEYFYNRIVLAVFGYLNASKTYNIDLQYESMYPLQLGEKEDLSKLLKTAFEKLNTTRLCLNFFGMTGREYSSYSYFLPATTQAILSIDESLGNVRGELYMYCNDNTLYSRMEEDSNKAHIKKAIFGSPATLRMSMNFDAGIMDLDSDIRFYEWRSGLNDELEKKFKMLAAHIGKNGLQTVLLPRMHLSSTFLEYYSKNGSEHRFFFSEKYKNYACLVSNNNRYVKFKREDVIKWMEQVLNCTNSTEDIVLRNIPMAKVVFINSVPNEEEIEEIKVKSKSFINSIDTNIISSLALKSEEEIQHPLIPFSPGQLGLVLVSGKIDGVVEEDSGGAHVIKGSTYKTVNHVTNVEDNGNLVESTIYSTGTSVALLTADGNYIELR